MMKFKVKRLIGLLMLASPSALAFMDLTCSPASEMGRKALGKVDAVLVSTAEQPEFESAATFQAFVKETAAVADPKAKMKAYLDVVGVDSEDGKAVVEFAGARDHSAYLPIVEKNLELTHEQAEIITQNMTKALLSAAE